MRAGRTYDDADVIGILVAEAVDGELSEICLRLSLVAICWICTAPWIAPNHTTRPACPHVDQLACSGT